MTDWDSLTHEFDLWRVADRRPTLWWRDDDAVAATLALDQLKRTARGALALAVIPSAPDRPLQDSLSEFVADWPQAFVLQHGISHQSFAAAGAKKNEFPAGRDPGPDLAAGFARLQEAFGSQFLPVLTPPWNRIDATVLPALPAQGFRGVD